MAENMHDGKFEHDATAPPKQHRVLPLFSLKGRTAIVTGAGAGIGFAVVEALAEAGANVAIIYNSNKKAIAKAEQVEKEFGVKCRAYPVNITSAEAVEQGIDEIVAEFNGRLDVFIANSGVAWEQGPLLDGALDHYAQVMRVNVDGTVYCARAAGRHFRRQKMEGTTFTLPSSTTNGNGAGGKKLEGFSSGSFVATASMSGHVVNVPQAQAAYNASKAAVIHLCRSLGVEWVGFARCNTVSPGYIKTELTDFISEERKGIFSDKTPMGREGEVHELKGAYLFLASDAASYVTGTDIIVDGGYCAP